MAQDLLSEKNMERANISFCQHGDSFLGFLGVAFSQKLEVEGLNMLFRRFTMNRNR